MKIKIILTNIKEDSKSTICHHMAFLCNDIACLEGVRTEDELLIFWSENDKLEFTFDKGESWVKGQISGIGTFHGCDCTIVDLDSNMIVHEFKDNSTIIHYSETNQHIPYVDNSVEAVPKAPEKVYNFETEPVDIETTDSDTIIAFVDTVTTKMQTLNESMTLMPKKGDLVRCFSSEWGCSLSVVDLKDKSIPFTERFAKYKKYCDDNNYDGYGQFKLAKVIALEGDRVRVEMYGCYSMWEVIDEYTLEPKTVDNALIKAELEKLKVYCHSNNYHDIDEYLEELLGGLNDD